MGTVLDSTDLIIYNIPGGSDGKESVCNEGSLGPVSGLARSPGEGNGNLLQYSCLENPMALGSQRVGHDCVTSLSFSFNYVNDNFLLNTLETVMLNSNLNLPYICCQ